MANRDLIPITANRRVLLMWPNVLPISHRVNTITLTDADLLATAMIVSLIISRLRDPDLGARIKRISGILADLADEILALFS